jgi:hypothetical protein
MQSQIEGHSLFVIRIEEAMRPLLGVVESSEIKKYGLQAANSIYDNLFPYRNMSNGIPHPGAVPKEQAVAQAFEMACKHLNLLRFVDFSEIEFLLDQGHKDAAAVMCGGELEKHLRKLCVGNGVDVFLPPKSAGEPQPKRPEQLNAELASISVYGKLDQKHVTSWLDLRNKAAHGDYHEYNEEQVLLMIQGVREFMTRYPA